MSRDVEVNAELQRARKALAAAELLYRSGLFQDGVSRCYYAVLHAAKAALLTHDVRVDSHDAVKRLFGKELVKAGVIEQEFASILRRQQDDRLLADYDVTFAPEDELLQQRIRDAQRFVERIELHFAHCDIPVDEDNP